MIAIRRRDAKKGNSREGLSVLGHPSFMIIIKHIDCFLEENEAELSSEASHRPDQQWCRLTV